MSLVLLVIIPGLLYLFHGTLVVYCHTHPGSNFVICKVCDLRQLTISHHEVEIIFSSRGCHVAFEAGTHFTSLCALPASPSRIPGALAHLRTFCLSEASTVSFASS